MAVNYALASDVLSDPIFMDHLSGDIKVHFVVPSVIGNICYIQVYTLPEYAHNENTMIEETF